MPSQPRLLRAMAHDIGVIGPINFMTAARTQPMGVAIMDAIHEGRPHRVSGELAAHVVEIIEAAEASMRSGAPVPVRSSFPALEPMAWAR